jgi:hypothetical protein
MRGRHASVPKMIRLWARPRGTIGSPPKTLVGLTPWPKH